MKKDEIFSLNFEQKLKFRSAIEAGFFDDYDKNPRQWRHTFAGAFLWKYPRRAKIIKNFKALLGQTPTWQDCTEENLRDFVCELQESGIAMSSVRTYCAELKALLNENYKNVPCSPTDFSRILSVKKSTTKAVYLTREEMQRIIDYRPVSRLEHAVRKVFCIAMLTGARRIDAERLSMADCDIDTQTICYVPQKTPDVRVIVPIDEKMSLREFLSDQTPTRSYPLDTFNDTIRRICMRCGIDTKCTAVKSGKNIEAPKWQLVSSHTARRSFATNLYLAGISIEDIALMMGHGKNIENTKRYLCAERNFTPDVRSYFQ